MDEQRKRIIEDCTGFLRGEIQCDPLTVAAYSTDASLYQIPPLGVAFPKDREDVTTLSRYSAETRIPLIPRGAGSQVAGGALGTGLIVDFTRHMRRIESIGENLVEVEAGVFLCQLNEALRKYRRYFPPDPANARVTTIGGVLAVDAAGSRSVRVGSARDYVRSIEMVLSGGHCIEFGNEPWRLPSSSFPGDVTNGRETAASQAERTASTTVKQTVLSKLAKVLDDNEGLIRRHQPSSLLRNCSGYFLRDVLSDDRLRMPQILVGSEGTLGLFTSAKLHTAPLPEHRGIVVLLFGQIESALQAVQAVVPLQPSACDLMDRRLLTLARESDARFERLIPNTAESLLIVEQTGFSTEQARDRIQMVVQRVRELNRSVVAAYEGYTFDEVEFIWELARGVVSYLTRLSGEIRPVPFLEDVAVPPEATQEFLVAVQRVLQKHKVTASLYAHAAAGQIHLRPFLPSHQLKGCADRMQDLAQDVYEVAFSVGGSVSGEHGNGLSRSAFVRSQYGPLYEVFRQVKGIFDPHNLMNPGKVLGDDPRLSVRDFRPPIQASPKSVDLQLRWSGSEMAQAAGECNGCAVCRTQSPDLRMCPFFHLEPDEEISPRAKANLMRHFACGTLPPAAMGSTAMRRLADFCFNCKQCQLECPASVDIPHLMLEAKAAHVAANGLDRTNWFLSHLHWLASAASAVPFLANWVLRDPMMRILLERIGGVHRDRKIPPFARRTFLQSARRDQASRKGTQQQRPAAAYFVDYFANFHDPELAKAFVAILEHNGLSVSIPAGQLVSGMAMVSTGDVTSARRVATANVREFVELAREGIPIVCTEPSAAVCWKSEYPLLLDHPDVRLVGEHIMEAGAFLRHLHEQGKLRTDFQPLDLDVAYHTPCHLKALRSGTPLRDLLDCIPKLRVQTIDEGCSGMAGLFGMKRQGFEDSLRIGDRLISRLRSEEYDAGTTECSSCKMQMEQGPAIPTVHPLKLLASAYGLIPVPI